MRKASVEKMRYWFYRYQRSNLTKIEGPGSDCAYKKASFAKVREWYHLSHFIDDLKVLSACCHKFVAAGFIERDGVKWFRVETADYSYEIEADKL